MTILGIFNKVATLSRKHCFFFAFRGGLEVKNNKTQENKKSVVICRKISRVKIQQQQKEIPETAKNKRMSSSAHHFGYYGSWVSILLLWIGGWTLIDVSVQHFVKSYPLQMLIYASLFILGTVIFFVSQPQTKKDRMGGKAVYQQGAKIFQQR